MSEHQDQEKKFFFREDKGRRTRQERLKSLTPFLDGYTPNDFMSDFAHYFDADSDFNLSKIREEISKPDRLASLIQAATDHNTHPVIEFIQDLFKELGQSGDTEWSGHWK